MSQVARTYPTIVRDIGPASSGGASKTQRVKVRLENGWVVPAHAKFARDENGVDITEGGIWGVCAELVASLLAAKLGLKGPNYRPVILPPNVPILLRDGIRPQAGYAVAALTLDHATDVNGEAMLAGIEPEHIAGIVILDTLMQAGDRGHNMIRGGEPPEVHAIDHASGLAPERTAAPSAAAGLVVDQLIEPTVTKDPSALRDMVNRLPTLLPNSVIGDLVAQIPDELLPAPDARGRISAGLRSRRDGIANLVEQRYPGKGSP